MEDIVYSSEYLCKVDCKNKAFLNEFVVYYYNKTGNCFWGEDCLRNEKGCFEKIPPDNSLITTACYLKKMLKQILEQFAKEVS